MDAISKAIEALESVADMITASDADAYKEVLDVIAALQAEQAQEPVAWKHSCAAILTDGVELWVDRCPHCGKPRTKQARQDMVLVPVEPTEEMQEAGHTAAWKRVPSIFDYRDAAEVYKAMITAAKEQSPQK